MQKSAFPAVVDERTRVVILGSLPGDRSLIEQKYYAHPSNAFWWLIGETIGIPSFASTPYSERVEQILRRGVGLWDFVESASRHGSLDSAIRDARHRDLLSFSNGFPELRAFAFNGGAAARRARAQLYGQKHLKLIDLPSSSSAFARVSRETKLTLWRDRLSPFIYIDRV